MQPLISVPELAADLASGVPDRVPVLLDVRWRLGAPPGEGAERHARGHLPGARFVDLDTEVCGPPGSAGRHPLPGAEAFAAAMRRAGVRAGADVVVYDDGGGSAAAARLWWTLRWFGHHSVRVLDGGLAAWEAAGQPLTAEPAPAAEGDFVAVPGGMPVLDADGAARLAAGRGLLLDARAPERYRGEVEPVDPVAGHVPGAINLPAGELLDPMGRVLPPETLVSRFVERVTAAGVPWELTVSAREESASIDAAPRGAGPDAADVARRSGAEPGGARPAPEAEPRVGAYCGSGVFAALEVLALRSAGVPAALYVGSWSEWTASGDRPVATGPERG
ncbi:sulfurtransferase [Allostreptomyces psammosilenae]|uniref:Thiosulfate/3-mercaptopyruvate sulfurtransferase n=1 Tax=Allostreptomyces psammosilenae TaxID=1892865 RepID=A0A852ZWV2_9ACTN|nr:sulfurtransferase [Allostreptomyces psammosilenae]NYI03131.1 thiosulfate/3-mercaptopyruvate sulfurtransferase [Allostreptomyces psammosilenae]